MNHSWFYLKEPTPNHFLRNMAMDEFMLHSPITQPIVRLYRWDKPTYSIGYFQSVSKTVELYACEKNNDQVVRRITGGGLVKHGEEWTLSIAMDTTFELLPRTALEIYSWLHKLLVEALLSVGYSVQLMKAASQMNIRGKRDCFEEPVNCDVELGGKKIIGSSQRKIAGRILCQTSIQLPFDEKIAESVLSLFEKQFGQRGEVFSLSSESQLKIEKLIDQKYTKADFSYRNKLQEV